MVSCAADSVIPATMVDQLAEPVRAKSRFVAVDPTWSPTRKAIKATSTPNGISAGSAGDEATAAAARRPVHNPTAYVSADCPG